MGTAAPAPRQEGMWGWRPAGVRAGPVRKDKRGGHSERGCLRSGFWGQPSETTCLLRRERAKGTFLGDLPRGPRQTGGEGGAFPWVSPQGTPALRFSGPDRSFAAGNACEGDSCGSSGRPPASAPEGSCPRSAPQPGLRASALLGQRLKCTFSGKFNKFARGRSYLHTEFLYGPFYSAVFFAFK